MRSALPPPREIPTFPLCSTMEQRGQGSNWGKGRFPSRPADCLDSHSSVVNSITSVPVVPALSLHHSRSRRPPTTPTTAVLTSTNTPPLPQRLLCIYLSESRKNTADSVHFSKTSRAARRPNGGKVGFRIGKCQFRRCHSSLPVRPTGFSRGS